ncbi:diacylglycerol kinase a-like protein [Trifolium pratense]|uniref:Diacylglycerol kinase a-like protein n=1 Tax=Trifolium pratense TaxID=57577 RepID=A0A2K3LC17_TRIPR|nr:diacylglycerol kinase a-like protein [Trifolium pratense]
MHVKKINCSEWELVPVPTSVRAVVALNLHSYGSGRNPWGNLKPEYLDKRGFVEAQVDDGLLEIFGLKQGWHASFVMVELISAKHIAQYYPVVLTTLCHVYVVSSQHLTSIFMTWYQSLSGLSLGFYIVHAPGPLGQAEA